MEVRKAGGRKGEGGGGKNVGRETRGGAKEEREGGTRGTRGDVAELTCSISLVTILTGSFVG